MTTIKPAMKLKIPREIWLRGTGSTKSKLYRSDKKKCCVGIFLSACGVKDEFLIDKQVAHHLKCPIPEPAYWLIEDLCLQYSVFELYRTNDDMTLPESEREQRIKDLFLKFGNVEVEFV